jgi:hypothetical protein
LTEGRHFIYLVLDYDEPNRLHRAPIGDTPQVTTRIFSKKKKKSKEKKSKAKTRNLIQNRIFSTSARGKDHGPCMAYILYRHELKILISVLVTRRTCISLASGPPLFQFRSDGLISATVRGVDLYPPPVGWVPPNCILEVDDVLEEWTWRQKFDLIHMRLLLGAFTPEEWGKVYKNVMSRHQSWFGATIEAAELMKCP